MSCICTICFSNDGVKLDSSEHSEEDSSQVDPVLSVFKRVSSVFIQARNFKQDLISIQLYDKASVSIESLFVDDNIFENIWESMDIRQFSIKINTLIYRYTQNDQITDLSTVKTFV